MKSNKLVGAIITFQIICAALSLALTGAVIWVAWHFISKYL